MANRYFGIDLENLASMSDQQLAQYADRAKAMKRLMEILPILEQHFETLIQGQCAYEQFIQRVLKQATAAGKQIDKAILDVWLLDRGYNKHLQLMAQKARLGAQKQDAKHQSAQTLNLEDYDSALQVVLLKHQFQSQAIRQRLPQAKHALQVQQAQRIAANNRRNLLTHGTGAAAPMQRARSFFSLW